MPTGQAGSLRSLGRVLWPLEGAGQSRGLSADGVNEVRGTQLSLQQNCEGDRPRSGPCVHVSREKNGTSVLTELELLYFKSIQKEKSTS